VAADEDPARRIENELLFRRVNDEIEVVAHSRAADAASVVFLCECSRLECSTGIELTPDEYRAVRAHRAHFAVSPGHVDPEIEQVVEQHQGFWVLEKNLPDDLRGPA